MPEARPSSRLPDKADFGDTDVALYGLHPNHFIVSEGFICHEMAET